MGSASSSSSAGPSASCMEQAGGRSAGTSQPATDASTHALAAANGGCSRGQDEDSVPVDVLRGSRPNPSGNGVYIQCGLNGCVLEVRHLGLCAFEPIEHRRRPPPQPPLPPAVPGRAEGRTIGARGSKSSDGRRGARSSTRGSGTASLLDMIAERGSFPVDKPDQELSCQVGHHETGGDAATAMLRDAFGDRDENMLMLRGHTYKTARRIVLFQRRSGVEEVIAAAVIKLASSQASKVLEVPILVVKRTERRKGLGRIFLCALREIGTQLDCGLIVAWAAGTSLPFWERVNMLEKQATKDAVLKQAISNYMQSGTVGFMNSKMVAALLG